MLERVCSQFSEILGIFLKNFVKFTPNCFFFKKTEVLQAFYEKRDSDTGVLLWILQSFSENLFCRTPPDDCFWIVLKFCWIVVKFGWIVLKFGWIVLNFVKFLRSAVSWGWFGHTVWAIFYINDTVWYI